MAGLEKLVNEVMVSSPWTVQSSWKFRRPSHINLLEMRAVEKLIEKQAKAGPQRTVCLVDSNVTRCALGKGRSSSLALSTVIRRISSTMVAFGQYLVTPFCPTRLNCADDPTRERPLRPPVPGLQLSCLSESDLWAIASIRLTNRWASNWVRLVLTVLGPYVTCLADRSSYRFSYLSAEQRRDFGHGNQRDHSTCAPVVALDFDQTLGFPGEGPFFGTFSPWVWAFSLLDFAFGLLDFLPLCLVLLFPFWPLLLLRCRWGPCWVLGALVIFHGPPGAIAMEPLTSAELARAALRATRPVLPEGRPTLDRTSRLRERYWLLLHPWHGPESTCKAQPLSGCGTPHTSRGRSVERNLWPAVPPRFLGGHLTGAAF